MAKKRANGEGSIIKRPNGTYEGRYTIDGKRKSIYGKTKSEVREALTNVVYQIDSGLYIEESELSVNEWMNEWLNSWVSAKPSTVKKYDSMIRTHISPTIGNVKIKNLSAIQVQKLYKNILGKGLSVKTLKCIHGMLSESLKCAVKIGMIYKNVCDNCQLPKSYQTEMHPLTAEELSLLLAKSNNDEYNDVFFVAAFTGLRQSELIGLTWDCIDFNKGTIRVYRQLNKTGSKDGVATFEFNATKNGKDRILEPAIQVMKKLKDIKNKQAANKLKSGVLWHNEENFVFTQKHGMHISDRTLYKHFKKYASEINRPEVRFHDLRHTFATLSLQNGTDIKTVSSELGHATVAFTLDKYGHVNNKMRKDASEKMTDMIINMHLA